MDQQEAVPDLSQPATRTGKEKDDALIFERLFNAVSNKSGRCCDGLNPHLHAVGIFSPNLSRNRILYRLILQSLSLPP